MEKTLLINFNNLSEDIQLFLTSTIVGDTSKTYISSVINIKENNINYLIFPVIREISGFYFSLMNLILKLNQDLQIFLTLK